MTENLLKDLKSVAFDSGFSREKAYPLIEKSVEVIENQQIKIADLRLALETLIDEVLDIRGVDIEEYKPRAFEDARKILETTK